MQTLMVLIWCIPLGVLVVGGILNMPPTTKCKIKNAKLKMLPVCLDEYRDSEADVETTND